MLILSEFVPKEVFKVKLTFGYNRLNIKKLSDTYDTYVWRNSLIYNTVID